MLYSWRWSRWFSGIPGRGERAGVVKFPTGSARQRFKVFAAERGQRRVDARALVRG